MDEQEREFDPLALLALLPFAIALWQKYSPARAKTPEERFFARVLNGIKAEMRASAAALVAKEITKAEWQLNFNRYTDAIYILSTAVLLGSFDVTESALTLGSEEWRRQISFSSGFNDDLETGKQKQNGSLLVRVGLYATAGWAIWQALRGIRGAMVGAVEEQRILGSADHCPDCLDEAAKGRQPIGTLRKIGDSVCRSNCHCRFVYYDKFGKIINV